MIGTCETMCPVDEIRLYVLLLASLTFFINNKWYNLQADQREIAAFLRTKIVQTRRIHSR